MKSKTYCIGFNFGKIDASQGKINKDNYNKGINIFEHDEYLTGYADGIDYYNLKV